MFSLHIYINQGVEWLQIVVFISGMLSDLSSGF